MAEWYDAEEEELHDPAGALLHDSITSKQTADVLRREEWESESDVEEELLKWPTLKQIMSELDKQRKIGTCITAMNMLYFSRSIISTFYLGHLGGLELAGGTLALMYANVTGFSILNGLCGGMEPLCSQACGARCYRLMGLTLQRGILIMLLTSIPVGMSWLSIEEVLLYFRQDAAIASIAKTYVRYLLPDLVATAVLAPMRIYLRCQCITKPLMLMTAVAMVFHIALNYVLVFGPFRMGAPGTALASCFTDFSLILMCLVYMGRSGAVRMSWTPWSRESLREWSPLMKLAVPSCAMTCLEWWCYEIVTLLTVFLPNAREAVAAVAIVLNGDTLLYAMQVSLAACACTRVGNELGANRPLGAYHASLASLSVSLGTSCLGAICLIAARSCWGKLFTCDEQILIQVAEILPIMGLMELGNFPQTVCCGVLKGSARPSTGAYVNAGAFYLVGIPVGVVLAFSFQLGLLGLWLGLLAAVATCALITVSAVIRTDWVLQASRARHLSGSTESSLMEQDQRLKLEINKNFYYRSGKPRQLALIPSPALGVVKPRDLENAAAVCIVGA